MVLFFFGHSKAHPTSLTLRNETGIPVRLVELFNPCSGHLISEKDAVWLQPNEAYFLPELTPVMHHYKICADGLCESAAMPIRDDINYVLKVVLKNDFLVRGIPIPDHWVGLTQCPDARLE